MTRSGNKSKKKNISLKSKEADVETSIIKMTEWCWQSRVKILKRKRKK